MADAGSRPGPNPPFSATGSYPLSCRIQATENASIVKIICAPDSFKQSLSAPAVAEAMAAGARKAAAEQGIAVDVDLCPIGDGGEGTMDALLAAMGGQVREAEVLGPARDTVRARYAICHGVGLIELAEASGLARVPEAQRNPMKATAYGTGQLIHRAIDDGCDEIIICVGGSATVEGGASIAQALGARFFDARGNLIDEPLSGGALHRIVRVEPPSALPPIRVACDVTNPLNGPNGAAFVYGPQKGANAQQVRELDEALAQWARIAGGDPDAPGAGAAGGAAFGLASVCGATLTRGIDLVLEIVHFAPRCAGASIVFTGEGRLDEQSLHGKACMGVAIAAMKAGVPTIAIAGSVGAGAERCLVEHGGFLQRYVSLADQFGLERSLSQPYQCIEETARQLVSHGLKFPFANSPRYT